jgi:hypothetical protein
MMTPPTDLTWSRATLDKMILLKQQKRQMKVEDAVRTELLGIKTKVNSRVVMTRIEVMDMFDPTPHETLQLQTKPSTESDHGITGALHVEAIEAAMAAEVDQQTSSTRTASSSTSTALAHHTMSTRRTGAFGSTKDCRPSSLFPSSGTATRCTSTCGHSTDRKQYSTWRPTQWNPPTGRLDRHRTL